jgi:hypothetical protein
MPASRATPAVVFLAIGIVFATLGAMGDRPAFLAVGLVFLVLGFIQLVRGRRAN